MDQDKTFAVEVGRASLELDCLASLASQAWRLARVSKRALEKLPEIESARIASQVRYLERQMEGELARAGVSIVDLEGQAFDAGIAATALNAGDFAADDDLRIAQMIEPVVMGREGLLKYGVVMLERVRA